MTLKICQGHTNSRWRSNSQPHASHVPPLTTPHITHLCLSTIFILLILPSYDFEMSSYDTNQILECISVMIFHLLLLKKIISVGTSIAIVFAWNLLYITVAKIIARVEN